jgi:hypothetical protein
LPSQEYGEKKEIENYLHRTAIVEAYGENQINLVIPADFNDFDDIPNDVAGLVHIASGSPRAWNTRNEEEMRKKNQRRNARCAIVRLGYEPREIGRSRSC